MYSQPVQYTVRAAARATGVSESRLRTWERRYGIPSPPRSETGRRLYEEADLAVIRRMAALVDAGLSAAQAADAARTEQADAVVAPVRPEPIEPHPAAADLVAAAVGYDEARVVRTLRRALEELGAAATFERAIFPALGDVGRGWQRGELAVANEHFISELLRRETFARDRQYAAPAPGRRASHVLLACPAGERHDLAIAALWLLLTDAAARSELPRCRLALQRTWSRLRAQSDPGAICLSAIGPASVPALAEAGRALIGARVRGRLYVGGPALGYASSEALEVPGVRLPTSLRESADILAQAAADGATRAPEIRSKL